MRRLFLFAPLLLLYCTLVTLAVTEHHRCMHDRVVMHVGADHKKARESNQMTILSAKRDFGLSRTVRNKTPAFREERIGEEWKPIRIKLVTDHLMRVGHDCTGKKNNNITTLLEENYTCTDYDELTPEKENILINEILPEAIELHKERLFVQPLKDPIVVPEFSDPKGLCFRFIPKDHKTRSVSGYDMVLFAAATPTTNGAFAWAATCATLGHDGRPVIGIINYGPRYIVATPQRVRVAAHEIAHALGFNSQLMERKSMVRRDVELRGKSHLALVASENTLREVVKHYNCNSTKGMELSVIRRPHPAANGARTNEQGTGLQGPTATAILALTASVQEEYELGESHSNVIDGRLTGEESVGSDVQERRGEEGSSAAKFTQNVHHSSNDFSKRRSLHVQAAVAASETPSECTDDKKVETATGKMCIVETFQFPPNGNEIITRSHWSRRNAKDELMVGVVGAGYYTAITMGVFADLGYYKVNWKRAEQMSWGNNSGCELLEDKCVKEGRTKFPDMFCTTEPASLPAGLQCTSDRQSLGSCSITTKTDGNDVPEEFRYFSEQNKVGSEAAQMDYCPFIMAKKGYSCINGEESNNMPGSVIANNSRCVEGKDLKANNAAIGAVCVEVSCKFKKVIVRYSGNKEWHSCPEGKNLTVNGTVLQGNIVCPKYADVCNTINKTLDESEGPSKDPDIVEEVQTSQPESTEATETAKPPESAGAKPSESAGTSNNSVNQEVAAPVVQNGAGTTTESKPSETKEENNTSSVSGQNNNAAAKKGTDGSFKASAFASVMFVFLSLSMIMAP
ncbi:putative surface protease GP63, putative,metallopeptidase [Trypanosoma theileri]|uniref:Leishmanolysin-like peptidase n=1 Tax=Trypanosoma theileri TaxID=67003 RepID=A0A1X0NKQ7_9TRYP|nr:putative surface protease GP63, putative,metallopeptidase [Trypanosoma theileri]ORC85352.1 putative surface protease GP63, putative,metallopeptidase [Trypanosoma theileri]